MVIDHQRVSDIAERMRSIARRHGFANLTIGKLLQDDARYLDDIAAMFARLLPALAERNAAEAKLASNERPEGTNA